MDVYSKNIETHIRMSPSSQKLMTLNRKCDIDFVVKELNQYEIVPKVMVTSSGHMNIQK